MGRHVELSGMLMRPCSMTLEQNEEVMKLAKDFTESDFKQKYIDTVTTGQIIAESAKIYIIKNWEKIKDWKDLEIKILDNTKKITEYYNFQEATGWVGEMGKEIRKGLDKSNKKRHNPIEKITQMVLDPTDGDFSVMINGREHLWIDDESVIMFAAYIEEKLKK